MEFKEKENKLYAKFEFKDFNEAFGFIARVGLLAEQANHHPRLVNVYNTVEIELSTHDEGDVVTEKDHNLAKKISQLIGG